MNRARYFPLERGNPAYFPIFFLSRRAIKTRVTETLKKMKKIKKYFVKK